MVRSLFCADGSMETAVGMRASSQGGPAIADTAVRWSSMNGAGNSCLSLQAMQHANESPLLHLELCFGSTVQR